MSDITPIPSQSEFSYPKLCECGCGQLAPIAKMTNSRIGHTKGEPIRFINGHNGVKSRVAINETSLPLGTRTIPLTQGKFAIVDAADYEWLSQWTWYAHKSGNTFYAQRAALRSNGKRTQIPMHVAIMGRKGCDHIDGNGLNNTRGNLRLATTRENNINQRIRKDNTSGYKGVHFYKPLNKWIAYISLNGKRKHIGYFATAKDAARAYDDAARELHGEFAWLNFGVDIFEDTLGPATGQDEGESVDYNTLFV